MGIEIANYKEFISGLDKKEQEIKDFFASIMRGTAYTVMDQAKANSSSSVDTGKLSQSIHVRETDSPFSYQVGTNLKYGAYVEFGTGRLVEVPPELKELAIEFKGKGIREVNLPARPYLYPALQYGRRYLIKQITANWKDLK